jgi:hypothetical protein
MDVVADIARKLLGSRWELWLVIFSALVAAWLEQRGHLDDLRGYHAWWSIQIRRAATKARRRKANPS